MTARGPGPANPFEPFERGAIEQSIPERFESRVRRHPERLALAFGSIALSYEALNRAANGIAHALLARRGPREEPVALVIRQAAVPAAILGALKAGKAYVPLEATWPAARLAELIAEAGAGLVLADRAGAAALSGPGSADVLEVETLNLAGPHDDPRLPLHQLAAHRPRRPDDPSPRFSGAKPGHRGFSRGASVPSDSTALLTSARSSSNALRG